MRKPKARNLEMRISTPPMSNEERARKQKEISQKNRQRRKKEYLVFAIKLYLCGVAVYYILKKIKK